jgi:hypothetical protein
MPGERSPPRSPGIWAARQHRPAALAVPRCARRGANPLLERVRLMVCDRKLSGIIWNYHGNQRLAKERKKVEGRRKKHQGSTRSLILISIIAIGFHERHVSQDFLFF